MRRKYFRKKGYLPVRVTTIVSKIKLWNKGNLNGNNKWMNS